MRELAVAQKQIQDEEGNTRVYDYAILVGEAEISPQVACESYGVRIRSQGGEVSDVPNITVSISRIDELMDLLVRNVVTPCTLRDVVDDWL